MDLEPVLRLALQVPLEMVEKTDLLLQLGRVVLEKVFYGNILSFNPLDVVKVVLLAGKYLGRVIEIDSIVPITQNVAYPIF